MGTRIVSCSHSEHVPEISCFHCQIKTELFSLCRTVLLKFLNDSLIRYFILFKLKFELLPSISNTVNKLHNIDDSQRPVLPERHEDAQTFGG